jgi:hypothetical protein
MRRWPFCCSNSRALVQLGVEAVANDAAVARANRRIVERAPCSSRLRRSAQASSPRRRRGRPSASRAAPQGQRSSSASTRREARERASEARRGRAGRRDRRASLTASRSRSKTWASRSRTSRRMPGCVTKSSTASWRRRISVTFESGASSRRRRRRAPGRGLRVRSICARSDASLLAVDGRVRAPGAPASLRPGRACHRARSRRAAATGRTASRLACAALSPRTAGCGAPCDWRPARGARASPASEQRVEGHIGVGQQLGELANDGLRPRTCNRAAMASAPGPTRARVDRDE